VVERSRVSNMCLNTQFNLDINVDKNGDQVGPFRGVSGTLGREGRRERCGYSEIFYVVASTCVG
jgi:hypothetical protein